MSLHSFDPDIAKVVGVNAATIYQNILFWTQKNLANGRNVYDGHVWTYNSIKAWADLFPYLSRDQIRRALAKLVEAGMIAEGNYNKSAYDRTKWYGVPCQIHLAKTSNGFEETHEPIPVSKPNDKPDDKPIGPTSPPPKKRRKPEVDLPEGWVPSDKNIQDALKKGLAEGEIADEADRFRDHHHSKQSRFRDWDAAWRTWCGNAVKFRASRRVAGGQGSGGHGQGLSLAGIVARRRIEGKV